jgi:dienelactone hydrolase
MPDEDNAFQGALILWTPDERSMVFTSSTGDGIRITGVAVSGRDPFVVAELPSPQGHLLGWDLDATRCLVSTRTSIVSLAVKSGTCETRCAEQHDHAWLDHAGDLWLTRIMDHELHVGLVADAGICAWQWTLPFDTVVDNIYAFDAQRRVVYLLRHAGMMRQLLAWHLPTGVVRDCTPPDTVVAAECERVPSPAIYSNACWFFASTSVHAAEVYRVTPDSVPMRMTSRVPQIQPATLPESRRITWQSAGWEIEGILVLPTTQQEAAPPYPTVVYLHGGPELEVQYAFETLANRRGQSAAYDLAAAGFAVLLPNVRGSRGYGRAFMAELGDYHLFDQPFADVMAGVDTLVASGIADPARLGIYGFSYGAELALWAIGHTSRFAGAVGICGRYDQEHLARCSGAPFHTLNATRLGAADPQEVWQKPELWQHLSPMHHIDKIQTPVLLVETAAERRPGTEAQPLLSALLQQGVESHLRYYPEAFHGGGWHLGYQEDYSRRLVAWFRHILLGEALPARFSVQQEGM